MYRKFWLMNSSDEMFELTNVQIEQFLSDPDGLGFSKTYSTVRLGNSEVVSSEYYNMPTVTGNILFYHDDNADKYQAYLKLTRYLTYTPIRLYYQTPNVTEPYFAYVNVIQLDKSEVDSDTGYLSCGIQLKLTSFWLTATTHQHIAQQGRLEDGKYYELVRDPESGYHYSGSTLTNIELINNGTLEAGLEILIVGDCTDPQINFFQDGEQYGAIKFTGTYDNIVINSNDDEEDVTLMYQGSVIANPLSYQDLSVGSPSEIYVTFVKLALGQSTLTATFGNSFDGYIIFKWRDTYATV